MSIMPDGVKVYFGETLKKRLKIENKIKEAFINHHYNYIELPIYEFYKDIEDSFSDSMKSKMFKMVDRDTGELVALRPDMTSLMAKLIKLRKEDLKDPEKIFYIGDVFRYEKIKSGTYRQVKQAGIEYIGGDRITADIEVITLAIDTMKVLGLKNPKIEIGDVRVFNTIFEKLKLSKNEIVELKDIINRKAIPELENIVEKRNYNRILLKLPMLIGGIEILDEIKKIFLELEIESEFIEFESLINGLAEKGYSEYFVIDMGILKEMEYYTGAVFNGITGGFGDYVLSGGRYDGLMGIEALGFAINVDAIVDLAVVN